MMQTEYVVWVNERDHVLGTLEKYDAHRRGLLHRAFSVFVFNTRNQLLLQQRAHDKYHSGGLWTNTCCSHPRPGEGYHKGAQRRLFEEMGMQCPLVPVFSFVYKAELDNGLTEHELDQVFTGTSDYLPHPNPNEVAAYRYVSFDELNTEMAQHPERFTAWFRIIHQHVQHRWEELLPNNQGTPQVANHGID